MEKEKFTIPAVGGIIEDNIDGEDVILIQKRFKDSKDGNGLLEIYGGSFCQTAHLFS